ncbi:MAG: hypothetical protein ABW034_02050 [Steroidobacteraceae bacterium]
MGHRGIKQLFPDGKFVHLHRDGLETALSMREHVYYKLAISWALRPPSDAEQLDRGRGKKSARGAEACAEFESR